MPELKGKLDGSAQRVPVVTGSLTELNQHLAVNYLSARTGKLVPFEFEENGQIVKLTLRSKFAANEGIAYIDAGLRGFGIIQPSRYMVAEMLDAGTLCEILPSAVKLVESAMAEVEKEAVGA